MCVTIQKTAILRRVWDISSRLVIIIIRTNKMSTAVSEVFQEGPKNVNKNPSGQSQESYTCGNRSYTRSQLNIFYFWKNISSSECSTVAVFGSLLELVCLIISVD